MIILGGTAPTGLARKGADTISRYSRTRSKVQHYTTEGRRAVLEALRAGRQFERIMVAEESLLSPSLRDALREARARGVRVEVVGRKEIDRRAATKKAQGILAIASDARYCDLQTIVDAPGAGERLLMCVLDGVQDPHNLGAVARTLEAVGGHGLVVKREKSVGITPGAVRASAGALEHLRVANEKSIPQTLKSLRALGVRTVGLSEDAPARIYSGKYGGPLAVVVGNEHHGISEAAQAECDEMVSIPLQGRVGSLNLSVAAGLLFYEVLRQRRGSSPA